MSSREALDDGGASSAPPLGTRKDTDFAPNGAVAALTAAYHTKEKEKRWKTEDGRQCIKLKLDWKVSSA